MACPRERFPGRPFVIQHHQKWFDRIQNKVLNPLDYGMVTV